MSDEACRRGVRHGVRHTDVGPSIPLIAPKNALQNRGSDMGSDTPDVGGDPTRLFGSMSDPHTGNPTVLSRTVAVPPFGVSLTRSGASDFRFPRTRRSMFRFVIPAASAKS